MKGRVLGFLVLLAWGILKGPLESRLTQQMLDGRLGGFKPSAGLLRQAGQAGLIAALGGLRAAVADLLWIRAHIAWQDVQYGRMKLLFDACTAMQPRRVMFWDVSAWQMAWNGAAYVERSLPDEMDRRREMTKFFKVGEAYLLRGIENNPDSWELYERLGALYREKFKDPQKSADAYDEASKRPGHLAFTRRFAAYQLAQVPGREREAYGRLLALYREGPQEWLDTLLKHLQLLERKLKIPPEQRVDIPPDKRLPPE